MNSDFFLKSALGAILLTVLYWLSGFLITSPQASGHFIWNIFANFLVALLLGYFIKHAVYRDLKLSLIVFLIYFIIGHFNILIEAWIFNVTDRLETTSEIIRGLLVTAVFSPAFVYLFRKEKKDEVLKFAPRSFMDWAWRILLGDFLYLVFYLVAGFALYTFYPQLMDFYEGKIPPFDVMIKTQLFLRGFIFVAIAILILRTMNLPLAKKAIFIGLFFTIIGGVAPLIPPNEFMPGYIRLGHGFEVAISNFLYGLSLSLLFSQKIINSIA